MSLMHFANKGWEEGSAKKDFDESQDCESIPSRAYKLHQKSRKMLGHKSHTPIAWEIGCDT